MKYVKLIIFLLLISSCQENQIMDSNVPWYINERIKTGIVENYNYVDSLKKYKTIKKYEISNQSKYDSYLIDLEFKVGIKSKEKLQEEIRSLIPENSIEYCEELIKPALEYVTPNNRPDRRYSKPYITDLDFDYFIEKCIECNYIQDSSNIQYQIGKLKLSNIMLKDQWFRIPSRVKMPHIQEQYDIENRKSLDLLLTSNQLNFQDEEIRSSIRILLLHSTDCEWTKKWLKIYFVNYSNYSKYISNLNWFLRRSVCEGDEITNMVKKEISRHSK